jgi:hypothetical protein
MDQPDERNIEKHNLMAGLHGAATESPYIKDHILRLLKRAVVLKITNANDYPKSTTLV